MFEDEMNNEEKNISLLDVLLFPSLIGEISSYDISEYEPQQECD